jgi:pimeloyl-ACP methyl ester carboxylesterase
MTSNELRMDDTDQKMSNNGRRILAAFLYMRKRRRQDSAAFTKAGMPMLRSRPLILTALLVIGFAPGPAARALELADCRISAGPSFPGIKARCGTLLRPENPDDAGSPEIEIAVAVVPALDLEPERDPFVPLAGGPGASAIEFYAAYSGAFEYVRRHRDILLVDQRGTGSSSRMDCDVDDHIIEGRFSEEQVLEITRDCLSALPHDPRFFTTSVAVTDLEAVRQALGYGPLNLYGVSYGSRVAQQFAKRYPDSTRSIILDGVVPPQVALGPEIATEAQEALDAIFARCAADEACNARFPNLSQAFRQIRAELEEQAVTVEFPNPVTGDLETGEFGAAELAGAIRLLAYRSSSMAIVPLLIDEAAGGNFDPLAAQFHMIAAQMSDALALGMHNSVMCSEDAPFYDEAAIDYDALEESYIGVVQLDAIEAMCSVWPAGPVDDDFRAPLDTAIPVLLLSGDADPITPPRYASLAMVDLERARHLIGAQQGHGQAAVGCTPRLIGEFVASADPLSLDAGCLERSFVMPFFLDFGGPAP